MGSDEQIAELGRVADEYAASKRHLAALVNEMDRYRKDFIAVAKHLSNCHITAMLNGFKGIIIPTKERLELIGSEINQEFERKQLLAERLKAMGLDVQNENEFPFKVGPQT